MITLTAVTLVLGFTIVLIAQPKPKKVRVKSKYNR